MHEPVTISPPPRPPYEGYSVEWANRLVQWLQVFAEQQNGIMYLRAHGMILEGFPVTGYGLKAGEVFTNAGIMTMVREGEVWAGGFGIEAQVGSVTVNA